MTDNADFVGLRQVARDLSQLVENSLAGDTGSPPVAMEQPNSKTASTDRASNRSTFWAALLGSRPKESNGALLVSCSPMALHFVLWSFRCRAA